MARVKVPLADNLKRVVFLDSDATEGATIGTDLRGPDGEVLSLAGLRSLLGVSSASDDPNELAETIWRLVREVPPNVSEVEVLATSGLVVRRSDGDWLTRALTVQGDGLLELANGDGEGGNPLLGAADIAARSVWGRSAADAGKPAPITADADGGVLRRLAGVVGFGQIPESSVTNLVDDLIASNTAIASLRARTYITANDESVDLPDSLQIVAGANITLDASTPGELEISSAVDEGISPTWTGQHQWTLPTWYAAGSVAAPGIAFTSDTDTGLYSIGADQLGIAAGSVRIASARLSGTTRSFTVGDGTNGVRVNFDRAAGVTSDWAFQSAGVDRWYIRVNSTAESGSDVGSDFAILRRNDSGAALGEAVRVMRSTGQWRFEDGSAALPVLSFLSDTNTGFFRIGADNLGVSAAGALVADFGVAIQFRVSGVQARFQFNETDVGADLKKWEFLGSGGNWFIRTMTDADAAGENAYVVTRGATTAVASHTWRTGNADRMALNSSGQVAVSDGSQTLPGLSFLNDLDTGLYRSTTNTLDFATAGVSRGHFRSDGGFVTNYNFRWTGEITATAFAADTHNWTPTDLANATVIRASASAAALSLTGMGGQGAGRLIIVINVGANAFTLVHESASSTAAARFALPGAVNLSLAIGASIMLWYDNTSQRWRSIAAM